MTSSVDSKRRCRLRFGTRFAIDHVSRESCLTSSVAAAPAMPFGQCPLSSRPARGHGRRGPRAGRRNGTESKWQRLDRMSCGDCVMTFSPALQLDGRREIPFRSEQASLNPDCELVAQATGLISGIALVLVSRCQDGFRRTGSSGRSGSPMGTQRRYKRTSTPSDPKHMTYYVGAPIWRSSRDVDDVTISRDIFDGSSPRPSRNGTFRAQQLDSISDHGRPRLSVRRGRRGGDWLADSAPPPLA